MATFKANFTESANMNVIFSQSNDITADFGNVIVAGQSNVKVATTEEWNLRPTLIGEKNIVYVYTDHTIDSQGNPIPAFKVGDGLAYLIDIPFNSEIAAVHIADTSVHVGPDEREFWNNKVTAFLNILDPENLILTKE